MAAHFEKVIVQHLVLPGSLQHIVEAELPEDLLPSDDLGAVFRFCHDYWHASDERTVAPPPEVLYSHPALANAIAEHEIDLAIEPEGELSWALDMAQGAYINRAVQPWIKTFSTAVVAPDVDLLDKPQRLDDAIQELMELQGRFVKRSMHAVVASALVGHLADYHQRAALTHDQIRGARLGIGALDQHTMGVRDGELAILAAGPKVGKSFWMLWAAYCYWLAGGSPVLFTLENSVEMALTRLVCMVLGIDYARWDQGHCEPEEIRAVEEMIATFQSTERPFHILQPETNKRTIESMVRKARTLGDALYIDQLTFVEPSKGTERRPRHEQIRDMLHELKALISTSHRMPCVLAHQINREGVKAAEKLGYHEMYHMAESSEVERTGDWVISAYQGAALRDQQHAVVQILAARRADLLAWDCLWSPYAGEFVVHHNFTPTAPATS